MPTKRSKTGLPAASSDRRLTIGLPKGSLQEATVKLMERAGFKVVISERSYTPSIDDSELAPMLLRAQEMSRYVEQGVLDCGITGNDWVLENHSRVERVAELMYAKRTRHSVRWVLAVPDGSKIKTVKDLEGKRIATEVVNVTKKYLKKNNVSADVEFSWGATEAKANMGLIDGIVEVTETGSSLRANNLRIIDEVLPSTTQFIANKAVYKNNAWKRKKMDNIALLLNGAISAEGKVGLKMNVSEKHLAEILQILPAMKTPTISRLSQSGWFDVDTIIDERVVRNIIPKLKDAGAEGIIEYPLNKAID